MNLWHTSLLTVWLTSSMACGGSPASSPGVQGAGGLGGSDAVNGAHAGQGVITGTAGALANPFIHRNGRELVDASGQAVPLLGVAFGNNVWGNPTTPVLTHHDERDFAWLETMGMTLVRFYLNYQLFESDSKPYSYNNAAFLWLDQNVAWAKKHGVRLFLNMHVPQGGFQSNGAGNALWDVSENQARLEALWTAIAKRYHDEPTIAGYDLLNEPRPTKSRDQWVTLATRLTKAVRAAAPQQLIIVERTNSVGDDWSSDKDMNFFTVPDENVAYEFHSYEPFAYSHQFASWVGLGEGGKYPDPALVDTSGLTWYAWSLNPEPPKLPVGTSDWAYYESRPYDVSGPQIKALGVSLISELNPGTVYFDDVVVKEFDSKGVFVRNVVTMDLETLGDWYFWQAGTTGKATVSSTELHSGKASLSLSTTDHDANLGSSFRFVPRPGYRYAVGAWMKGVGTGALSRPDPRGLWTQNTRALVRLDYFSSVGPVLGRTKQALAANLDKYVTWGKAHNVPLYLGEFGLMHFCFEGGRGGELWVRDMFSLLQERKLAATYHTYHEPAFGLFQSDAAVSLPSTSQMNVPLHDALVAAMKH